MRQVKWNELARKDYFENIDYLLNKWTEKEAQNFIDQVDEILFILSQGRIEYQETNHPNVRRCVIREQITLFYKIVDKNQIELLRFWNDYQDNEKLAL